MNPDGLHLVYVDGDRQIAYFTDQPLTDTHGDGWNTTSYEHNASPPYPREGYALALSCFTCSPKYGSFHYPKDGQRTGGNSHISVQEINQLKAYPWISDPMLGLQEALYAGATYTEFKEWITRHGAVCTDLREETE